MHMLCTICSDLMGQTDSIYVIKCGHIFHHNCLAQWIARSKTCPQCRKKVTESCMFRMYPTISNDTGDDATTLQSRLDDALLQLRQLKAECKEKETQHEAMEIALRKNEIFLVACEKKLRVRESESAALKDQLEYVKVENKEIHILKEENGNLKKNIETLNGLQKVLNATSDEVEVMLQGYSDIRTIATFATALKRALCESEMKKNETRDNLQTVKRKLTEERALVNVLRSKLRSAEMRCTELNIEKNRENKRDAVEAFGGTACEEVPKVQKVEVPATNNSFTSLVNSIENSDSPYLKLKQSNLALTALQQRHPANVPDRGLKPSEFGILNAAKSASYNSKGAFNPQKKKSEAFSSQNNSIFHKKEPTKVDLDIFDKESELDVSYDGLGGHSKPYVFPTPNSRPAPKSLIPKLSAKHKLKRPNTAGSQDISKMLKMTRDID
ncbi:E3 ubiquitin-protein ligase TRAIP-like [Battus philenor]|uniref:E3 ubiquitin-protein ligase TRAIP-like n=1 Tax=Battus philenor TaxID=42288 RepID=UPI0035CEFB06